MKTKSTFLIAAVATTLLMTSRISTMADELTAPSNMADDEASARIQFWVAPSGDDLAAGTQDKPFATFARAQKAAQKKQATVWFRTGVYYLTETVRFDSDDSGVTYSAGPGETPVISGGGRLELQWEAYRDGILRARTPAGLKIDQLFVNGARQLMARYPNYDQNIRPYGGFSADAFDKRRAARWTDPAGGFIHAMHSAHWGGYHYRITGKNGNGDVTYEGGWQNNRQMGMHREHRYVENIFEELDSPGEWFHDQKGAMLYYLPPEDMDLKTATIEVVRLRHLVEFNGSQQAPVRDVTLRGFAFRHAARTFMEVKEPLLRSDWTIYRSGALLFNGVEGCVVEDCEFDQLGGNAIFVNNYNHRLTIRGCDIHDTGASAIAFVGDPKAVRNPLFEYGQRQSYATISKTPGPQTDNYPADCLVEDCLIRRMGVVEKQATGVELSMSSGVTIRHCSIYEASRAGINISEGTFGGHVVEFCDVFDTVRETGDHGSFNSWGRDRFWGLNDVPPDQLPQLALLDIVKPNVIRNSRWRCDHGWDVDLDDGSSNYEIYNNLFLAGGLKLREGFHRKVWNNITVNNSFHPHVWYENSGDEVTRNIWMGAYRPAAMSNSLKKWGREVDFNLFTTSDADRLKFVDKGCDAHSLVGDPLFVDPDHGDYRVREGSPALKLGFQNFPMDQFGVQKPELRAIARIPELPTRHRSPVIGTTVLERKRTEYLWQAAVRNISGLGDRSAFGLPGEYGVLLLNVPAGCVAAKSGLQPDDVILSADGKPVRTVEEMLQIQNAAAGSKLLLDVRRKQAAQSVMIRDYAFVTAESQPAPHFKVIPLLPGSDVVTLKRILTQPQTMNEPTSVLTDGTLASNYGPVFGNGVVNGSYKVDLGTVTSISQVNTFSFNQNGVRGRQRFILYGSSLTSDPGWDVQDLRAFTPIAVLNTSIVPPMDFHATSIRQATGGPLGSYRWLIWAVDPVTETAGGENSAFQEFQVIGISRN